MHVAAPLVQNLVAALGLDKRDDARRAVNLGVDRLGRDELGQELLGLGDREREEGGEAGEGDAGVVAGDDADVLWVEGGSTTSPADADTEVQRERGHTCSTIRSCSTFHRDSPLACLSSSSTSPTAPAVPAGPNTFVRLSPSPYRSWMLGHLRSSGSMKHLTRSLEAAGEGSVSRWGRVAKSGHRDALRLLHLLEPVVLVHAVEEVALLVVVRRQDEEVDDVAQDGRGDSALSAIEGVSYTAR